MSDFHDDEYPVSEPLVRRLITEQFPHWASLPLSRLGQSGSSNVLYRLGSDLLVRVPRQPGGGASIVKEHRWLPEVSAQLPVATPEIVALGEPSPAFPEHWAITNWLDGDLPSAGAGGARLTTDFATVVRALAEIAVPAEALADTSLRNYRGGRLADIDAYTRRNIVTCRTLPGLDLDLDAALALWDAALVIEQSSHRNRSHWFHGDLVAENLLVRDGRLVGILDFGGLSVGDPTIDLHGAWELLDDRHRGELAKQLAVPEADWQRARAWALAVGLMTFAYYWSSMPTRIHDRLVMARAALAG